MGFVTSRADKLATMLLAAAAKDAGAARDLISRGADVVIAGSAGSPAQPGGVDTGGDAVIGAWIAGKAEDEAKAFREAGFDFVVFDPDKASAMAVLDEGIGYVLALPNDLTDVQLRTLETFHLDAIYVGKIDGALSVRRQIDLQRVFALTRKPLIASIAGGVSAAELQALRDANIAVVLAEGADNVAKLRTTIDALPPRTKRRDDAERPAPLVPRGGVGHEHDDDDD
jgi:predicted Fe-Mo cluster-binding NifX family protein